MGLLFRGFRGRHVLEFVGERELCNTRHQVCDGAFTHFFDHDLTELLWIPDHLFGEFSNFGGVVLSMDR